MATIFFVDSGVFDHLGVVENYPTPSSRSIGLAPSETGLNGHRVKLCNTVLVDDEEVDSGAMGDVAAMGDKELMTRRRSVNRLNLLRSSIPRPNIGRGLHFEGCKTIILMD